MSREVEVTGIKMTATVPEDLQLSLGQIGSAVATPATEANFATYSLANSTGVLVEGTASGGASDGKVHEPSDNAWDWSNSADISAYYAFGRLIPASSTTGENIYYTPDASGVGKTIKGNASFYLANDKLFTRLTNDHAQAELSADAANTNHDQARATLHAYTAKSGSSVDTATDTWTKSTTRGTDYTQADDWKVTYDDGYYVDIPIWIRTSSNENVNLAVDGYVIPGTSWTNADNTNTKTETELELYRAVRVALLDTATDQNDGDADIGTAAVKTTNIIPLKDAWDKKNGGDTELTAFNATQIKAVANPWADSLTSIVDSVNLGTTSRALPSAINSTDQSKYTAAGTDGQLLAGVSSAANAATDPDLDGVIDTYAGTYSNYTCLTPASKAADKSVVATIPGSTTGGQYGTAKKLVIRVWLDGEDGECWNDNAGQDWAISLKFAKIES